MWRSVVRKSAGGAHRRHFLALVAAPATPSDLPISTARAPLLSYRHVCGFSYLQDQNGQPFLFGPHLVVRGLAERVGVSGLPRRHGGKGAFNAIELMAIYSLKRKQ